MLAEENDWQFVRNIPSFTRTEIQKLFKTARRILNDSSCSLLIAPRIHSHAGLLVVTSRKIGNAPERNKTRRRIKAIFYEEKLFNQKYDCVIIVKKPGISLSFSQWKELLIKNIPAV